MIRDHLSCHIIFTNINKQPMTKRFIPFIPSHSEKLMKNETGRLWSRCPIISPGVVFAVEEFNLLSFNRPLEDLQIGQRMVVLLVVLVLRTVSLPAPNPNAGGPLIEPVCEHWGRHTVRMLDLREEQVVCHTDRV